MTNPDEENDNANNSNDYYQPSTHQPGCSGGNRPAGTQYYRRSVVARLERDHKEYVRLSRRLYHNGRVILEAWVTEEFEGEAIGGGKQLSLEELEMWEDLWIALWRKRRRLSRTINALTREIADIDSNNLK